MDLVFEYTDYRTYLRDSYQERKAQNRWFSYGVIAQKGGFKARDFLLRVMRGDRCLSRESARKVAVAFDLESREAEYFQHLVEYNQARTEPQREHAWGRMQSVLGRDRQPSNPVRQSTDPQREVLSRWHHLAIRSLLDMQPVKEDWEELGRRLQPPCSAGVVKRSMRLLEMAELVARRPEGYWSACEKNQHLRPEMQKDVQRSYYRDCLKLAGDSIEGVQAAERSLTGLTLGISETTYGIIVERLAQLREDIVRLADQDTASDRVYQLNLLLFPLSRKETQGLSR